MVPVIRAISEARDFEIEAMMAALLKRYGEVFPDWEIDLVTIEKTGDRNKQIDDVIRLLEKLKEQ